MRVRLTAALAALLAVLLAATASAPPDELLTTARRLAGENPGMWADASIVRAGRSLLVIAAGAPRPDGFVEEVERARQAVGRVWGMTPAVVLVPASTGDAAVLAKPADVRGMAALADVDHVIVEPDGFGRLSPVGRRVVLAHELTHVATGAAVSGRMPMWLVEGFADYVGYLESGLSVGEVAAELAVEVRAGVIPRELPQREDFAAGSARLPQVYEEAWLACRYVAERYGAEKLVELYRAARDGEPNSAPDDAPHEAPDSAADGAPEGVAESAADSAMVRTLGVTVGELTEGWRAYLRQRLVGPV